ncbi:MAG: hypothetical protein HC933_04265 [Pleurocapsa sp. SU_196_0]|nr:hypothetical protein [Pleurocapsa sp. SU_196_0]
MILLEAARERDTRVPRGSGNWRETLEIIGNGRFKSGLRYARVSHLGSALNSQTVSGCRCRAAGRL